MCADEPANLPEEQGTSALIAVDEDYDSTSDYGSSIGSDYTSLKSSIMNYVFENGRRYHAYQQGKYLLPNDETEQDRLDMMHLIFKLLCEGELTRVPIEPGIQRILDIGTGTGIWALEMADLCPSAEVIGTDLSPIQPSWVPPNCSFDIDDCEQQWLWPMDHFDFIHARGLCQSVRDWPKLTKQMFEHTKPGGYVELVEQQAKIESQGNFLTKDSAVNRIFAHWHTAAKKLGLPQPKGEELAEYMKQAGFEDVTCFNMRAPLGGWPSDPKLKDVSRMFSFNCQTGFEAYFVAMLTRVLGMNTEEAMELCDGSVRDVHNRKLQCFQFVAYVTGRKPLEK